MWGGGDMNISLVDVDGHNFPNLALMKISAWHKSKGDKVEFHDPMFDKPDLCYASKVFSFTPDFDYFPDCEIIKGGTGYDIKKELPPEIDKMTPDYSLYNCQHAYGFLTRGCIRKCPWCVVPEKEGDIKPYMDIDQILNNNKSAILMDNNVLSSDYGISQIEKIIKLGIKIDFNQGLDARLIDDNIAKLLSEVKWIRFIRLACDSQEQKKHVQKAVQFIKKYTKKEIFIYVLIKDIDEALERIEFLRELKTTPFAQPFRDIKNNINPTWEQKKLARWVNLKKAFKTMEWEYFKGSKY